jgi:hypothetical protein
VVATPEFSDLPEAGELAAPTKPGCFMDGWPQHIASLSVPKHYIVRSPCFARAPTAEAAIAQALATQAKHAAANLAAATLAADSGLPELSGTPKQIAWAMTLRAVLQTKNPKHPSLKRATTAKFWIDKRF